MTVVGDLMSYGPLTVNVDATLASLVERLRRIGHEGYPVIDASDNGRVVGLLTARELNRAAVNGLEHLRVRDVMLASAVTVTPDTPLKRLLRVMVDSGWGQVPVTFNNTLIGIVTRTDVIRHYAALEQSATRDVTHEEVVNVLGAPPAALIAFMAQQAAARQQTLYIVGGIVRDLLLKRPNLDIDFVLEGNAIAFTEALQAQFGGEVATHSAFGTAKWTFDDTAAGHIGHPLRTLPASVDVVTARHEFYEEPAILPTVYNSNIKLDLRRRDFTINALAVRLSADGASGAMIDLFGGTDDLNNGVIRVLHSLSFADDPTRVIRAVRYAARLGFTIEPRTAELIQNALPMLSRITGERVRNDITRILHEDRPEDGLLQLQALGVLQAIHPAFVLEQAILTDAFEQARHLDLPHPPNDPAAFGWMLVAASMDAEYVEQVAKRLLFANATAAAMESAAQLTEFPERHFGGQPSAVTFALEKHPLDAVLGAWVALPAHRATIEQYLNQWRHVRIVTDGNTLKGRGLKPGPQFKTILDNIRAARIDGTIASDADEAAYLDHLTESE
jgi:tRNA nucleotidyltransferase (CCA-adding enzyme)